MATLGIFPVQRFPGENTGTPGFVDRENWCVILATGSLDPGNTAGDVMNLATSGRDGHVCIHDYNSVGEVGFAFREFRQY